MTYSRRRTMNIITCGIDLYYEESSLRVHPRAGSRGKRIELPVHRQGVLSFKGNILLNESATSFIPAHESWSKISFDYKRLTNNIGK
jgi:hypothetical protein